MSHHNQKDFQYTENQELREIFQQIREIVIHGQHDTMSLQKTLIYRQTWDQKMET
jgi:hypothetical protein